MAVTSVLLTIVGLTLFEIISSIDNAIINAQVLETMTLRARRWFLTWGLFFAVVLVRGLLPWIVAWAAMPSLGPIGSLTAAFSSDPRVAQALREQSPILLCGGGIFLVCLFLQWFMDERFMLSGNRTQGASSMLRFVFPVSCVAVFSAMSFVAAELGHLGLIAAAAIGTAAFFAVHSVRMAAEKKEAELTDGTTAISDFGKIMFLQIIDASFSIDGVIGAFAFTLSVPLILVGNGIGAWVVRELTVKNSGKIASYPLLQNGAMYSIGILGTIMLAEAFGVEVKSWVSPLCTIAIVGFFLWKSTRNQS